MAAYYNEFDPYAAQWLRNLIAAGHIAPGDVDERSIVDVRADDLRGYTQCHFFAGIGGWSVALRLAGCPDDREVWTGSCPCQPFSIAGAKKAQSDERHLWPHFRRLIKESKPTVIFGEQVEAGIATGWLDDVCSDLEEESYACAAAVLPAYGVTAPHGRNRIYFVADLNFHLDQHTKPGINGKEIGMEREIGAENDSAWVPGRATGVESGHTDKDSTIIADSFDQRCQRSICQEICWESGEPRQSARGFEEFNGGWPVHSPKLRSVDDGLRYGASQIRAYGNAIVPQVAAEFIKAYIG